MASAVKHPTAPPQPESVATDGRSERWREHRDARRADYIAAAMRAIEEYGPEARMEQIAAAAGVAKPKLYRYFADRADLVNAVGDRCGSLVARRLAASLDPTASLRATIAAGLDDFLAFVEENPNTIRFLLNSVGSTGGQNVIIDQGRRIAALLVPFLTSEHRGTDQASDAGSVSDDGAEPLAHAAIGSILGATDWWLLAPAQIRMPRARLVEHLTIVVVSAAQGTFAALGRRLDPDVGLMASRR
jgi:AcrR family transcriptional regulator